MFRVTDDRHHPPDFQWPFLDGFAALTRPVRCCRCKAHGEALVTPAGVVAPAGWWRLFAAERFLCSAACALGNEG